MIKNNKIVLFLARQRDVTMHEYVRIIDECLIIDLVNDCRGVWTLLCLKAAKVSRDNMTRLSYNSFVVLYTDRFFLMNLKILRCF